MCQEDLRIAWPIPEQTARGSGRKLGADVGFELRTPVTEQMWGGERHRPVVGEYAIDVLDDVGTARAEDAAGLAEACASQRILEAIRLL